MESNDNIKLSPKAIKAIEGLQHKAGTYAYYRRTLDSLFTYILHSSDEMGMSDAEAIHTLRVLDSIREDLKEIAGKSGSKVTPQDIEELRSKIEQLSPDSDNIDE